VLPAGRRARTSERKRSVAQLDGAAERRQPAGRSVEFQVQNRRARAAPFDEHERQILPAQRHVIAWRRVGRELNRAAQRDRLTARLRRHAAQLDLATDDIWTSALISCNTPSGRGAASCVAQTQKPVHRAASEIEIRLQPSLRREIERQERREGRQFPVGTSRCPSAPFPRERQRVLSQLVQPPSATGN